MATDPARPEQPEPPEKKHRSRWIWVSALLGLAVVGLLVWALSLQSDLDDANAKNEQAQQTGSSIASAAKSAYEDLTQQLGATNEDLQQTEQDLQQAQQDAENAQKQADAAKQKADSTSNELDKAQAEADQAKAEAEVATSKAKVLGDCAKAYVNAAKGLLDGQSREDVKASLQSITDQCQAAFAAA